MHVLKMAAELVNHKLRFYHSRGRLLFSTGRFVISFFFYCISDPISREMRLITAE